MVLAMPERIVTDERERKLMIKLIEKLRCSLLGHKPNSENWEDPNCTRCGREVR